jgi:hypothetical protein
MVSYADIVDSPAFRRKAVNGGLRAVLGVPDSVDVYLDNGAFSFSRRGMDVDHGEYKAFVEAANPNWKPVAQDFIPAPFMDIQEQRECLRKTMDVNRSFDFDGYSPVVHISPVLDEYMEQVDANEKLAAKPTLAIGGIVPQLLRMKKSVSHSKTIESLKHLRERYADKQLHVFGVGGTATIHIAGLLGMNSVDSSGWRNRAARGMIQLPGTGERLLAELGSWRGRQLSEAEKVTLQNCPCPACQAEGLDGLKLSGKQGFCNRATHNLHVLLEEANWVSAELDSENYAVSYKRRLDNTTYRPLIDELVAAGISSGQ